VLKVFVPRSSSVSSELQGNCEGGGFLSVLLSGFISPVSIFDLGGLSSLAASCLCSEQNHMYEDVRKKLIEAFEKL